jgi:hypothetical protein
MSYAVSSNQRAVLGIGFEEKENLAIHRQEGHPALLPMPSSLGNNPPSLNREPPNKLGEP